MKCIPNGSDFKFLVKFKDLDGVIVNPSNFAWELFYYTTPNIQLSATHIIDSEGQHIYSDNVKIVDEETIEVIVDNFNFGNKGLVKCKSIFHFINPDFKDGIQTVSSIESPLNVTIV